MKCKYSYSTGAKECPHKAQKGKDFCIWHEKEEGKELENSDFSGMDLEEAYFVGAALSGCNFSSCMLNRANFDEALLDGATLDNATAKGASFEKTQMRDASCEGTIFKYSSMSSAILANCNMKKADLSWVILNEALLPGSELQGASLLDADLSNSVFLQASLESALLRGANLDDSDLQVTDLRGADFRNASLVNSNLRGADMRGSDFKYANLEGAILANSKMHGSDFARSNLKGTLLQGVDAKRCNFRMSSLEDSVLVDANFEKSNFRGINLNGANVEGAKLTDVELYNAKIEGVKNLRYATLNDTMASEMLGDKSRSKGEYVAAIKRYDEAVSTYIDLKNYFHNDGLYDKSGDYYIREWRTKGKLQYLTSKLSSEQLRTNKYAPYYLPISFRHKDSRMFKSIIMVEGKVKWIVNRMLNTFAKYGESPTRVLFTSMVIIITYALMYWISGGVTSGAESFSPSLMESIYFSAVTFTTLGYGDFQPKSDFQIFAISEALLGAFIMAFFVVVVSRRLIR